MKLVWSKGSLGDPCHAIEVLGKSLREDLTESRMEKLKNLEFTVKVCPDEGWDEPRWKAYIYIDLDN